MHCFFALAKALLFCFVNFCSLAVLESSVDEGRWGEAVSLI